MLHQHTQWDVRWVKDGRVIVKDCGTSLPEAMRVYTLAAQSGRRSVTLRSKNTQFAPPPEKYGDRHDVIITKNGRRYKVREVMDPPQYRVRMMALNRKGLWWCPFCMQMRRFVKRTHAVVEGIRVQDARLACPMCDSSHRIVGRYNPLASIISARVSDPNRKRRRRRAAQEEEDED